MNENRDEMQTGMKRKTDKCEMREDKQIEDENKCKQEREERQTNANRKEKKGRQMRKKKKKMKMRILPSFRYVPIITRTSCNGLRGGHSLRQKSLFQK